MRVAPVVAAALALFLAACGTSTERIVVAAGTTLVDSGFIERLLEEYDPDVQISVVASSSRKAFALGEQGAADLLITHLAEVEDAYMAENPGSWQEPAFRSRFIIVGPPGQNVMVAGSDVADAFAAVAAAAAPFVSRGDGSGTVAREHAIWELAGFDPTAEPWYIETGQGMGFTLQVADQKDAFTLVEGGTFFAGASLLTIEEVPVTASPDQLLDNPYRVTLIDPSSGEGGRELFDWLTSDDGRAAMVRVNEELYGHIVYEPSF